MFLIRLRLTLLALVVVSGQLVSTMATAVVAACAVDAAQGAAAPEVVCTCAHGPMAECPMHHRAGGGAGSSSQHRAPNEYKWCSSCDDLAAAILTTLAFVAPIVERHHPAAPLDGSRAVSIDGMSLVDLVLPVLSPPPRA